MTLGQRRCILIFFILFFTVTLPLILLYTAGYRYDFQRHRFTTVSLLVVSSMPTGAKIQINQRELKAKTPARVKNLLPNEYQLTISKENFQPWNKKLILEPKLATFTEKIILFYQQPPTKKILTSPEIIAWRQLDNLDDIILVTKEQGQYHLKQFNLGNQLVVTLLTAPEKIILGALNAAQDEIIISTNQQCQIFSLLTKKIELSCQDLTVNKINNLRWDQDHNNLILMQTADGLYRYNLTTGKKQKLLTEAPIDFLSQDQSIYYVLNDEQNTSLWRQTNGLVDSTAQLILPANSKNYQLQSLKNNLLTISDTASQYLYLVEEQNNQLHLTATFNQTAVSSWTSEKKFPRLLLANTHEIYVYDYDRQEEKYYTKILVRYTDVINQVLWHPAWSHIIFNHSGVVKAVELDERDKNNVFTLLTSATPIKALFINSQGDKLFYLTTDGQQDLLLEAQITEPYNWLLK